MCTSPTGKAASFWPRGPSVGALRPLKATITSRRNISRRKASSPNFLPGLCIYKFFYVWMDLHLEDGSKLPSLGWLYWLPNPLFPFTWYRIGLPREHPQLSVEEYQVEASSQPA